jgi:hypothetical protein
VDVVGPRELDPAAEGGAEAALLEQDRGYGKAEKREPDKRREDEGRREHRHRCEDEHAGGVGERERAGPAARDERAGGDVGGGHEKRSGRNDEDEPFDPVERRDRDDEDRGRDPERERGPEAAAVRAHRLGDELPHRPRLWRERRRQLAT